MGAPRELPRCLLAVRLALGSVLAVLFVVATAAAQQSTVLELIEVKVDEPLGDIQSVSDGAISLSNPSYSGQWTWNSPPQRMDASGFTLTMNVSAQASASNFYAEVSAHPGGFDVEPAGLPSAPAVGVFVNAGESKSDSLTITLRPQPGSVGSTARLNVGASFMRGVTYVYRYVGAGDDDDDDLVDDDGDDTDTDDDGRLEAELDCPPEIVISAYPPLNCHILITSWRRNTATPVEVILPDAVDFFGNHANGIQVSQAAGEQDVFNWVAPYSWGMFVFACPSQPNFGANCYDNVTTPGINTVNIIVRQGDDEVLLQLTLNAIARGAPPGTGMVARLGNVFRGGEFINIETGTLQAAPIKVAWLSAIWHLEPVEGTEFVRIRNDWQPEVYIHIETGLQAGPISADWWSAMWQVEPVSGTRFFRLRNRWRADQYLHMENGRLEVGQIDFNWTSAMWFPLD